MSATAMGLRTWAKGDFVQEAGVEVTLERSLDRESDDEDGV